MRVTDIVMDFVKGFVVAIPVFERVTDTDCVRVGETVIDLVNGLVVAIADFERVSVTD